MLPEIISTFFHRQPWKNRTGWGVRSKWTRHPTNSIKEKFVLMFDRPLAIFFLSQESFNTILNHTLLPLIFMTGVHPPSPHPKSPIWQRMGSRREPKHRDTNWLTFDLRMNGLPWIQLRFKLWVSCYFSSYFLYIAYKFFFFFFFFFCWIIRLS